MAEPLIFVTRRPPWPLDNGSRIRGLRLAQGLATRFELVLVTYADGPSYDASSACREDLERELPGVRLELVLYGRQRPGGARRNVLRARSDTFGHYATPAMRAALSRLAAEHPRAVMHLDDLGVALAGLGSGAGRFVFAPHNVEHRIMADLASRLPPTHRPFVALEARKIAAEERRLWRGADVCLAVSEIDAETMRAGGARRVEVCPNASDPHDALPLRPLTPGEPLRLLFVGSLHYWPYAFGMAWFVGEALAAVQEAAGPIVVDVVGDHPRDMARDAAVTYHGRVPELRPFYERAHAMVLPVFEGSGTRLKVIEAGLLGRPIVSTKLGVEGLPLRPDDFLVAEDVEGFSAAAKQLRHELQAADPALRRRRDGARERLQHLTWPRVAAGLADLYSAESQTTSVR